MSINSVARTLIPQPLHYPVKELRAKLLHRNDLNQLALFYQTDKWGAHWYTQHYQRYFQPLRTQRLTLLEIGVGGYENTAHGASSLRMWKTYFPKANIVGIDLYDKSQLSEDRIDIRQCDQTDGEKLKRLSAEYGGFDIIIDDGSHLNHHVIDTFNVLFPLLRPNGIYAIEDTQTAYWPTWGGGMECPNSSTAFFKCLTDGLNHSEFPVEDYRPSYFDRSIVSIAFFHNLIILQKGNNTELASQPSLIRQELDAARAH